MTPSEVGIRTPTALSDLLSAIDPQAILVYKHLWLIRFFAWIRGDRDSAPAALARLQLFLDTLQAQPEVHARFQAWWRAVLADVDATALLADHGFASRHAFFSEFGERMRQKLLPATPETRDATELFSLVFSDAFDPQWLAALDAPTLASLTNLLQSAPAERSATQQGQLSHWRHTLLEAITFSTSQVCAAGFSSELRLRMTPTARASEPFHLLASDFDQLRSAYVACLANGEPLEGSAPTSAQQALQQALKQFRDRLDACRQAALTVYTHLDEHGISVNLVFRLRQLRARVLRIHALLACLVASQPAASAAQLMIQLVKVSQERRSVRALIAANSSMLAAKVAERSSEVGEHYITRTAGEYRDLLLKAAGGGALTGLTTLLKFTVMALGLSAFWSGFWAGMVYAASFVAIQLLHLTLATKQPAMTAPAMAAKLKDLTEPASLAAFVDKVANLVRSQVAAIIGNVVVVFPVVVLLSGLIQLTSGHPMIDAKGATHVFHSLSLAGPTVLFAAFTGVLLFSSSIIAGWTENWFVMHRLKSAIRYNPRFTAVLGIERAERWSKLARTHISGLAGNVSLGFMLGLIPAYAAFFGIGLDVRHVTLSTGQLGAACASLGWDVWREPALWWAVASLPLIGALNVGVSFYCAFRLALLAHNVTGVDRTRIRAAILNRWRTRARSFFWPERETRKDTP